MARKAILNTVLFLRFFTLLAMAASIMVMVLNKSKDADDDGSDFMFYYIIGYRYVVAVGVGLVYTLVQIPFAVYNVAQEKRWIRTGCLQQFDFYGDKLIAFLSATGVGVGFGVTFELTRIFDSVNEGKKIQNMGNISSSRFLAGFASMALLDIISSARWPASRGTLHGRCLFNVRKTITFPTTIPYEDLVSLSEV